MKYLPTLNQYENAIVKNAEWFIQHQKEEGKIDVEGDEFYGLKGDATLVGHSVTVRMYAYLLTNDQKYIDSVKKSLKWLADRQDPDGGWKHDTAFTLDGAQCVFEGFNTYQRITKDKQFDTIMRKSADRMVSGTVDEQGKLLLPNVIEVGEYAHFSMLAWKLTGDNKYKLAGEKILNDIQKNFDEQEGFWVPFDLYNEKYQSKHGKESCKQHIMRWAASDIPLKGKLAAELAGKMLADVVVESYPQYAMNMMDSECLLDELDGSCTFPTLRKQTEKAIEWIERNCKGPFPGTVTESRKEKNGRKDVYPIKIINDSVMASTWPACLLLLGLCGLNEKKYHEKAKEIANHLLTIQDEHGGFFNFQKQDGSFLPLQSGNVNYYVCMALWFFNEVYEGGSKKLYTEKV